MVVPELDAGRLPNVGVVPSIEGGSYAQDVWGDSDCVADLAGDVSVWVVSED